MSDVALCETNDFSFPDVVNNLCAEFGLDGAKFESTESFAAVYQLQAIAFKSNVVIQGEYITNCIFIILKTLGAKDDQY